MVLRYLVCIFISISMNCTAMEQWALERRNEKTAQEESSNDDWGQDSWVFMLAQEEEFKAVGSQSGIESLKKEIEDLADLAKQSGSQDALTRLEKAKKELNEAQGFTFLYSDSDSDSSREEWYYDSDEELPAVENLSIVCSTATPLTTTSLKRTLAAQAAKVKKSKKASSSNASSLPRQLTPLINLDGMELPTFSSPQASPRIHEIQQVPLPAPMQAESSQMQALIAVQPHQSAQHAYSFDPHYFAQAYHAAATMGLELPPVQELMAMQQAMTTGERNQQEEFLHSAQLALEQLDAGEREVAQIWLNIQDMRACGMLSEQAYNRKCEKLLQRVVRGDFATTPRMAQLREFCLQWLEQQNELAYGQQELAYADRQVQAAHNLLVAGRNNHIAFALPDFFFEEEPVREEPIFRIPHLVQAAHNNLAQLRRIAEQGNRAREQQVLLLEAGRVQEPEDVAAVPATDDSSEEYTNEVLEDDVLPIVSPVSQSIPQQSAQNTPAPRTTVTVPSSSGSSSSVSLNTASSRGSSGGSSGGGSMPMVLPYAGPSSYSSSSSRGSSNNKSWCAQECCLGYSRGCCFATWAGAAAIAGIVGGVLLCKTYCPGKFCESDGGGKRSDKWENEVKQQEQSQQNPVLNENDIEWPSDWSDTQKEEYLQKLKDSQIADWWKSLKQKDKIKIVNKTLSELNGEQRIEYFSMTEKERLEVLKKGHEQWLEEIKDPSLRKERPNIVITEEQRQKEKEAYFKSWLKEQEQAKQQQREARREQIEANAVENVEIMFAGQEIDAEDRAWWIESEIDSMLARDEANMQWWQGLKPKDQRKIVQLALSEPGIQASWWQSLSEQERINYLKQYNDRLTEKAKSNKK